MASRKIGWALLAIAVGLLFLPASSVFGQTGNQDSSDVFVLTQPSMERFLALAMAWSYHPGDDPAWADPAFDDSSWAKVQPDLRDLDAVPGGWSGIGWFRYRVMLDPAVQPSTIGVLTKQTGACELYVDGQLAVRFGTVSADPESERAVAPQRLGAVTLRPGEVHLLAVRFSNARNHVLTDGFRGFEMWLGHVRKMVSYSMSRTRVNWGVGAGAAGIFATFALLHLLLFLSRPQLWENLYFTIFNAAMVVVLGNELWMSTLSEFSMIHLAFNVQITCLLAMVLSALLLERRVFGRRLDVAFWVVVIWGLATLAWIWTRPAYQGIQLVAVLIGLGLVDMLRLAVGALRRREADAWVVALGFGALTLTLFGALLLNFGLLRVSHWPMFIAGLGTLVLSFSIYLTRRVARTDRALAARLQEVQELTAQTLAQERAAREQEIARRLLEADNQRKTAELEEARRLQLAMLPRTLPELPGFELAVHMATASEVGGDYYDFLRDSAGGWTVAVGDATGHGLHAGMVVGVAKSLLQAANGSGKLAAKLHRIHSGLSSLHERRASMSLMLLRLNGSQLRLVSAGMPPMLVKRQNSGQVDEIMLPGVPLGTIKRADWSEHQITVAPGDSVLLMSDGLAEVAGPDGEPFGYDRVQLAFAEVGDLNPNAAVAHLLSAADTYRAGEVFADDVTLMVLRARPAEPDPKEISARPG